MRVLSLPFPLRFPVAVVLRLVAATACLVAATSFALAEIASRPAKGEPILIDEPLRAECWHRGVKVLDRGDLGGMDPGSILADRTLRIKQRGRPGASIVVLPLDDNLCIITPLALPPSGR